MKKWFLVLIFIISGCADVPLRQPAMSFVQIFGEVDPSRSLVKIFPNSQDGEVGSAFYLELKDRTGQLVDVSFDEIKVIHDSLNLNQSVLLLGRGRYEVRIQESDLTLNKLKFMVQKKFIKHSLTSLPSPSKKKSQLQIIASLPYELWLELHLRDSQGRPIEPTFSPEILIEGEAQVSEVVRKRKGIWHIRVTYPNEDQILYFSIRANRVNMHKLLRFQHIEK